MTDKQKEIADMILEDIKHFSVKANKHHIYDDIKTRDLLVRSYETFMTECRVQQEQF